MLSCETVEIRLQVLYIVKKTIHIKTKRKKSDFILKTDQSHLYFSLPLGSKTQVMGEIKVALKKEVKTEGDQLVLEILQCRNITYKFKSPDHLPGLKLACLCTCMNEGMCVFLFRLLFRLTNPWSMFFLSNFPADLYVKLYVVNVATQKRIIKKKTRVCRHDREPSFNETFRFPLNPTGHSIQVQRRPK